MDAESLRRSSVYIFLQGKAVLEKADLIDSLLQTRDHDEKTFIQGKIIGLQFLEKIADEIALDEQMADD